MKSLEAILRQDRTVYFVLTVLGAVVWVSTSTFFWRDDWLYLLLYQTQSGSLFNGNGASDIKPLFQYLLFPEFRWFGTNFYLYPAINVILIIVNAILMFRILLAFEVNRRTAMVGALILLLHPTNFVNACWIFSQCELAHLALVLALLLYFKKYSDEASGRSLMIYAILLCVQNYFFPNGILLPVLFLTVWFFYRRPGKMNYGFVAVNLVILMLHLLHAVYIQKTMQDNTIQTVGLLTDVPEKIKFFFVLLSNCIWRLIIPNFGITGRLAVDALPFVALIVVIFLLFKKNRQQQLLLIGFLGFLITSPILVMTRYHLTVIPYYYTSLFLPYLILIGAALFRNPDWSLLLTNGLRIAAGLLFLAWIGLDVKGKSIFSSRNEANHLRMISAVTKGTDYEPVDDPAIAIENYVTLDGANSSRTTVTLYKNLLDDRQ